MIRFKAKKLRDTGYSLHLEGNGGENELIFITSWGQDMRTRLVIVGAETDGNVVVLHEGKARVILAQVLTTVENVVNRWSKMGTKPTFEEEEERARQVKKLMKRFVKLWEPV